VVSPIVAEPDPSEVGVVVSAPVSTTPVVVCAPVVPPELSLALALAELAVSSPPHADTNPNMQNPKPRAIRRITTHLPRAHRTALPVDRSVSRGSNRFARPARGPARFDGAQRPV
jgi:hypothetical protein